jgi:hypothetical protein
VQRTGFVLQRVFRQLIGRNPVAREKGRPQWRPLFVWRSLDPYSCATAPAAAPANNTRHSEATLGPGAQMRVTLTLLTCYSRSTACSSPARTAQSLSQTPRIRAPRSNGVPFLLHSSTVSSTRPD